MLNHYRAASFGVFLHARKYQYHSRCLSVFQGWSEQQALSVQPPRQPELCWGRAEERPAAPLWGHPAGGSHITCQCFTVQKVTQSRHEDVRK